MPKKVFNQNSRSYGNPNKVASANNNTYDLALNREKFIRSYAPMTLEAKQTKQWSAPTSMSFVTAQQAVVTVGKDVQDQKTEYQNAPATISPAVTVSTVTHNTITLSLEKPATGTLTGYLVETYIGTTLFSSNQYALDGSYTIVDIYGLAPLTNYTMKVYSTNTGGSKSDTPTEVIALYTLPAPPTFSVSAIQTQSFTLVFPTPVDDVVYDVSLVGVSAVSNLVSGTPLTGLVAGTQYAVEVRARSVDATGLVSLPASTTVWTLLHAPTLSTVTSTPTSIQVGFSTTGTADSGVYQNTTLQTKTGGSVVSTLSTTSTSTVSVSGLTADTAYDLSLVSQYAHTKTDVATRTQYTHPIAPNLAITVLNNNSANLTFSQLFNHTYDISAIPATGTILSLHNIGSPYVLNSLTPSMAYTITGTSKYAASGYVSTVATTAFLTTATAPVLSAVTVNSDVSAGLQYTVMGATASSGALSTVRIVVKSRATGATAVVFNTPNVTNTVLTGLTPNTVYDLSMISVYANNQSDVTTAVFTTQPSVPTGLTISNLSYTSTQIFFATLPGLAYDVSAIPNVLGGGANFMSHTDITSGYSITGLSEGTSYNVYLFARNATNRSKPATQTSVITLLTAPTGLSVTGITETAMNLNFSSDPRYQYDVTWSNYAGNVGTQTNISPGQAFTGLLVGTTYTFSLTARKDRSSAPTTVSATTALSIPADYSIVDVSFTSFVIHFTELPNILQYDVSAIPSAMVNDPNSTIYINDVVELEGVHTGDIITGLRQGLGYTVYLHAHTHDIKSAPRIRYTTTSLEPPTGVYTSDITFDSVTVYFDQSTDPEYSYSVSLVSLSSTDTYLNVNNGDMLSGLRQGTAYTMYVYAHTHDQISSASETTFNTVLNSSDGLMVVAEYTVCLLTFDQIPGLMYDLSAVPLNTAYPTIEMVDVSSGIVVEGLSEGANYTMYLTTYTADIRNDPASISFYTYLSAPANIVVTDVSSAFTSAQLHFDKNPAYTYTLDTFTAEVGGNAYGNAIDTGFIMTGLPEGLWVSGYLVATSPAPDSINSDTAYFDFKTRLETPKNMGVANINPTDVTVYFNPPFPNPEYNVYYDASALLLTNNTVLTWPGVNTGQNLTGLTEGSPYRMYVSAYTDDEVFSAPSTFDFTTHINMPSGLSATDISFKSFRVWFTTRFGFTYDVSAVPSGGGATVSATDISSGYLFNNTLDEGVTYTVQLYAKTAYIRSPPATMSVTTTLSPPQNVAVSDISFTSFQVNYTQNGAYNYDVAVFDLSGIKLVEKTGVNSGVLISSADSVAIVEGRQYTVNVYTRSAYQISIPTAVSVVTLLSAPTGVSVSNVGFYSFQVNFTPVAGAVYDISAVSDAGAMVSYTGVSSGATVQVATEGILYTVYVRARTAYQTSLPTITTAITNLEAPKNFSVDTVTFTTVTIHFDVSLGLVYDMSAIHSDNTITWVENVTPGQVITGLAPGVAYSFDLFCERYGYKYSAPAHATATTLLQAPTGLTVSDISMTSLRVNFTALAGITYDATVFNASGDIHSIYNIHSGDVVTGLWEGELYTVSLLAKTVAQTSLAATVSAITLLSSPTAVAISGITYTGFAVGFTPVAGLVYDVSAIAQSNANKTQVVGYAVDATVTVPYDGVTYDVYVYARSPHIRSAPVHTTVTTLLHEPTGLAVSQILNTSVYYTFTTVAGLTYSSVFHPSAGVDISYALATPGVTVSGLISATAYVVSVYAHSAYAVSAPTTVSFVTYTNAPAKTDVSSTETTMTVAYFPFSADVDTGAFVQTDLRAVPRGGVGSTKTAVGDLTSVTVTDLTRGVVYDLSLVATYANTKSMPLLDSSYTIVNAPTGLAVSNILDTSAKVAFTVDADITYDVSAIPTNGLGAVVQTPGFVSGSTVSGLTEGTAYTVYLRGHTVSGIYSAVSSTTFITELGSITGVTTASTETTMTLNYTTPGATVDSGAFTQTSVTGVSRTDASKSYASGDATTAQLTGLVVGTVYDISMVAVYANTTSLTATVVANTGVSSPTSVTATVTGSTTATVSYDLVGGYTYDISAVPVGGVGATVTRVDHVYGTGLTGLTSATKYRVYVYAKSGGFRSSPASVDMVTYFTAGVTNGGVSASETQLTITYSYPTATTDSGAFQKVVIGAQSRVDGTTTVLESSASPAIYGGLVKGTIYDMSMIALYAYTQSAITTFTTNTTVDQPTGLAVTTKSDTSFTLSSAVFSDVVYDVSAIPSSGTTVTDTSINSVVMSTGYTFTGLAAGKLYTAYERARVGTIPSSYANITTTLLTPALILTVGAITSTSIAIGYTGASVVANSGAFVNVTGTATNVDDALDVVTATAVTTTPITFTGLRQGAKYNMVVVANFANTTSVPATSEGNITFMDAPTNLIISAVTPTSFRCDFTPPTGNVLSYAYRVAPLIGTAITGTVSDQTYIELTGLVENPVYNISITAVHVYGTSLPAVGVVEMAPAPITNLSATAYDLSSITFSYTDTNKKIVYYDLSATSTADATKQFNQTAFPYTSATTVSLGTNVVAQATAMAYCKGIAVTNNSLVPASSVTSSTMMNVIFLTANTTTTAGISYYRWINGTWSGLTGLTLNFVTTHSPTNPNVNGIACTAKCTRLVMAYGSYSASTYSSAGTQLYWANISGMTNATAQTSLTLTNIENVSRGYLSLALSSDGSRLVAGDNNAGGTGYVYFSTWDPTANNYTALTPILDTRLEVRWGLALSADGNKLVYTGGNNVYWSVWNGTNYKSGTLIGAVTATPYAVSIFKQTDAVIVIPNGLLPQYSTWNGTGYNAFIALTGLTTGTIFGMGIDDIGYMSYIPYASTAQSLYIGRVTQTLTYPVTFGSQTSFISSTASLLYCTGMALSDTSASTRLALYSLGNNLGIYYSRYASGIWSGLTKVTTTTFNPAYTPTTPYFYSICLTLDGSRCVVSYGSTATTNHFIYWADTTGLMNNTNTGTLAFNRINDSTVSRAYTSIALSGDGSRLVACNTNNGSAGLVYFSTWNPAINNYNALTPIMDTVAKTLVACALSADGNTLIYGGTTNNTTYYSAWNGSNYSGGDPCFGDIAASTICKLAFIGKSANYVLRIATVGAPMISKWNGSCYTQLQSVASGFTTAGITYAVWTDENTIYYTPYLTTGTPQVSTYSITYNAITPSLALLDTSTNYNITVTPVNNAGRAVSSNVVVQNTTYPPPAPTYTYTAYGASIVLNYSGIATDTTHYGALTSVKASAVNGATVVYGTATATPSGTITLAGLTGGTAYDVSMSVAYVRINSLQGTVTTITTSYLMTQLYNKTTSIGSTDAAGNTFTNTGSVAMANDTVRGYVYNFPSTTALLKFATSPVRQNVTLAFWIKYNADTMKSVGIITSKYFPIYYDASGILNTQLYSSTVPKLQEPTQAYHNEWIHYAITVQTTVSNGNAVLYKNGLVVSSITANTNLSSSVWGTVDTFTSSGITFGYPNSQATFYTDAGMSANFGVISQLDDMRVYATSYASTDISNIFVSGLGSYAAPQGLVAGNVVDTSFVLYFQGMSDTCVGRPVFNGSVTDGTNVFTLTDISSGYVVAGLSAGTAYTVTLNYTLNGTTSPTATLPVTTATIPSAPTGLSVTGTSSRTVTVGFTPVVGATYYDISATTGTTKTTERFPTYTYTGAPSFGLSSNSIIGIPTNNVAIAITGMGPTRLMFITVDTVQSRNRTGLLFSRFTQGTWSAPIYPTVTFDIAPIAYSCAGCAISSDATRLVVSFGPYGAANNILYYANAAELLYGSGILRFKQIRSTPGGYTSVGMSSDGSRIVFQEFGGADNIGAVYFTDWKDTNYNSIFTKTNETVSVSSTNVCAIITNDKSTIAYIIGTRVYYAKWNGTNYSAGTVISGTIPNIGGRNLSFLNNDASVIVASSYADGVYYSLMTNGVYGPLTATGIAWGNINGWGMTADSSNVYLCGYGQTVVKTSTITYTSLINRTSYQMSNLIAGSAYNFQMSATNANYLPSSYSNAALVTSVATPPTFTSSFTATSITLNYTATAGTGLTVYATAVNGANVFLQSATTTTGTITFSGLTTGTPYDVSMVACYTSSWTASTTKVVITPHLPLLLYRYTFDTGTTSGIYLQNAKTLVYDASLGNASISSAITPPIGNASLLSSNTGSQYMLSMPLIDFSTLSAFSITAWVYITSYGDGNNPWLVGYRTSNLGAYAQVIYAIRIESNSAIRVYTNGCNTSFTTTIGVALNTWAHVAFVQNGTSLSTYVNAVSAGTTTMTVTNTTSRISPTAWLGSVNDVSKYPGNIDDYRFYGEALSAANVTSIYNKTM